MKPVINLRNLIYYLDNIYQEISELVFTLQSVSEFLMHKRPTNAVMVALISYYEQIRYNFTKLCETLTRLFDNYVYPILINTIVDAGKFPAKSVNPQN